MSVKEELNRNGDQKHEKIRGKLGRRYKRVCDL